MTKNSLGLILLESHYCLIVYINNTFPLESDVTLTLTFNYQIELLIEHLNNKASVQLHLLSSITKKVKDTISQTIFTCILIDVMIRTLVFISAKLKNLSHNLRIMLEKAQYTSLHVNFVVFEKQTQFLYQTLAFLSFRLIPICYKYHLKVCKIRGILHKLNQGFQRLCKACPRSRCVSLINALYIRQQIFLWFNFNDFVIEKESSDLTQLVFVFKFLKKDFGSFLNKVKFFIVRHRHASIKE